VTRAVAAAAGGCHLFRDCGFPSPSLNDFDFKPLFSIGSFHFTKPELIAVLCMLAVIIFFWAAFAKPKIVPRKMQGLGEMALLAVRDQILRPNLGSKGDKYLGFLASLFFFIFLMNLMELIPVFQFPAMSRIGFVYPLALIVYILYLYLGFKTQGFAGYFKNMVPPDVPWWILPLLWPIEFLKFFVIQPATLAIRLFGNMFAGHLLLTIFMLATWYMMTFWTIGLLFSAGSFLMTVAVFALELVIDLLQAFIFTTLTATYIAASLDPAH
jgi:F-type H+-transporting ATPase subunit a